MNRSEAIGRLNDLIVERNKKSGIENVTIGLLCDIEDFNKILNGTNNVTSLNKLVNKWDKENERKFSS